MNISVNEDVLRMKRHMLGVAYVPTLVELEHLLDAGCVWMLMSSGRYWKARRNGMTKRWVRSPERFLIPIKVGLGRRGQCDSMSEITVKEIGVKEIGVASSNFIISELDPNK